MKLCVALLLFALVFLSALVFAEDIVSISIDKKPDEKDDNDCKGCGPYDGCCHDWNNNKGKPTCYNKNTHQCNNGHRLCPKGYLSCGKDCYNPKQYYCHDYRLIPIPENKCHAHSDNGGCGYLLCCPTEHENPCYNPNHQKCTKKGLIWRCHDHWGNEKRVCSGRGECRGLDDCKCDYGYGGKNCEHEYHPQCNCKKAGQKCCWDLNKNHGHPTCYDPKKYTCHHGKHLCAKGEKTCGKECYNAKKYECVGGKVVKKGDKKDDDYKHDDDHKKDDKKDHDDL